MKLDGADATENAMIRIRNAYARAEDCLADNVHVTISRKGYGCYVVTATYGADRKTEASAYADTVADAVNRLWSILVREAYELRHEAS